MTLSNFDLINIAKKYNLHLIGVYSKDELPLLSNRKSGAYIINLQDDKDSDGNDLGGTHWTCFIVDEKTRNAVYFDSFGIIYPRQVKEFCKGLDLNYNSVQIQHIDSKECGWFCIAFIHYYETSKRKIKDKLKWFVKLFYKDTLKNDDRLKSLLGQIGMAWF